MSIISANCTAKGVKDCGRALAGVVVLAGSFLKVTLRWDWENDEFQFLDHIKSQFTWGALTTRTLNASFYPDTRLCRGPNKHIIRTDFDDNTRADYEEDIHVLILRRLGPDTAVLLILTPAEPDHPTQEISDAVYSRIGIAKCKWSALKQFHHSFRSTTICVI